MLLRLTIVLGLLALLSVAGCFGQWYWLLDLCSHFRWQYLISAAILLLVFVLMRRFRHALAALVVAGFNLALIWPSHSLQKPTPGQPVVKLVVVNLNVANRSFKPLFEWLRQVQPDVLVVLELNRAAITVFDGFDPALRQIQVLPAEDPFGLGVWSRLPVKATEARHLGTYQLATIRSELQIAADRSVQLYATHPFPPIGADGTAARDEQLQALANWIQEFPGATVVAGDLNATPWSAGMRLLTGTAGLDAGSHTLWPWPTWRLPRGGALGWLFAVPIDHVLLRGAGAVKHQIGPEFGSDHRPVLLEFVLD